MFHISDIKMEARAWRASFLIGFHEAQGRNDLALVEATRFRKARLGWEKSRARKPELIDRYRETEAIVFAGFIGLDLSDLA